MTAAAFKCHLLGKWLQHWCKTKRVWLYKMEISKMSVYEVDLLYCSKVTILSAQCQCLPGTGEHKSDGGPPPPTHVQAASKQFDPQNQNMRCHQHYRLHLLLQLTCHCFNWLRSAHLHFNPVWSTTCWQFFSNYEVTTRATATACSATVFQPLIFWTDSLLNL